MRNAKGLINYLNYRAKGDNNCRFQDPQPLWVCVAAACGASAPSDKNTPLDFWSMYLADFVVFNDFRAPQALCGCVAAACGASEVSEK